MKSDNPFMQLAQQALLAPPDSKMFSKDATEMACALSSHGGYMMDVSGRPLWVAPGIYPPRLGSSTQFMLAHWPSVGIPDLKGLRALDVGCGTGALALFMLSLNADHVVASDIDPDAVQCASQNLKAYYDADRFRVLESDLFTGLPAGEPPFDLIVFNQPFHHPDNDAVEGAISKGNKTIMLESVEGQVFRRFLDEAAAFLAPQGRLLTTFSSYSNGHLLEHPGWEVEVLALDWTRRASHTRAMLCLTRKAA